MLFRVGNYLFSVKRVFICQKVIDSVIYPVVVALGIRTGLGITVSFLFIQEADLVSGGYGDSLEPEILSVSKSTMKSGAFH